MHQTLQKLNIRFVALVLIAMLLITLIPTAAAAESGSCGNGVTWSLSAGTLTISGSGAMYDYGELNKAPWVAYADSIRSVVVGDGVTKIGNFAFSQMENLTAVTIADSVQEIGNYAFFECAGLVTLNLGNGVKTIGQSAFECCTGLKAVRLPDSLETLRFHAFYRCESLLSITIPASVTTLEATVFAYCTSLCTAVVQANITELPHWTFYGCYNLQSVTITAKITTVAAEAFHSCSELKDAYYGGSGDVAEKIQQQIAADTALNNFVTGHEPKPEESTGHSSVTTEQKEDSLVTTDRTQSTDADSIVHSQTVTTQTTTGTTTSVVVDAVLEPGSGWEDVNSALEDAMNKVPSGSSVGKAEVNIHLKEDTISGSNLGQFAESNAQLNIHTPQGAIWHINGADLSNVELADNYRLSFSLLPLSEKSEKQYAAVGENDAFTVVFDGLVDIKVEVELPLGRAYALDKAVFFSPEGDGYQRKQAVVVDRAGMAHFYLGYVTAGTEYLIGINVGTAEIPGDSYEDAIIPDSMQDMFPGLEHLQPLEYVITGQTSSWGMDIGQVTLILVIVLVVVVAGVGFTMFYMNKRRLKNGYVPETDDEEEE